MKRFYSSVSAAFAVLLAAAIFCSCEKKDFWEMSPDKIEDISSKAASQSEFDSFLADACRGVFEVSALDYYIFKDGECVYRPGESMVGDSRSYVVFTEEGMVYDFWRRIIPDFSPECTVYYWTVSPDSRSTMVFESQAGGSFYSATLNAYEDGKYVITGEFPGGLVVTDTPKVYVLTGKLIFDDALRSELFGQLGELGE